MSMATVYLGLGSNLGDRLAALRAAVSELAALGQLAAVSSVYETEPWGEPEQPLYLNACCRLDTLMAPDLLHAATRQIEQRLGRQPARRRWGPRLVDVDLLLYDDLEISTPTLTIPHPRIAQRAFVLAPLAEIAPDVRIPGVGDPAAALLRAIPDAARQARLCAPPTSLLDDARPRPRAEGGP